MKNPKCCICGEECENQWGNNPWPLVKDEGARCCNDCNSAVVSFRIALSSDKLTKEQVEELEKKTLAELKK